MPTPDFRRKRPAPRNAGGWGKPVTETVVWTRILDPRETYRVVYVDGDRQRSERVIELQKVGHIDKTEYLGVMHAGRFKTLRRDRVVEVLEQLSTGHEPSIRSQPTYKTELPPFPLENAEYRIGTTAVSNRRWTVDLNQYTCTCPEKRIRAGAGYKPWQLGAVCDHMAKAITENLPMDSPGWTQELLDFLKDPRKVHIDNLR